MKKATWRKFMRGNSDPARPRRDQGSWRCATSKKRRSNRSRTWVASSPGVPLGSLLVGFGYFFLLFGALRFLQEQFKVLDGTLSWIPYLIVVVLAAIIIALTRLANRERYRQAATEGPEVREQSATRQQLEASIRALLPSEEEIAEMTPSKNSAASMAGVGGIMTGYAWGRYRGRQVRKRRAS